MLQQDELDTYVNAIVRTGSIQELLPVFLPNTAYCS